MKKIFKRIAAVATGVTMLGATLTGALALDFADYPSPYSESGVYDTSSRIVFGDDAKASDVAGAADIVKRFQIDSYTASSGGGGQQVIVSGGKTDQVPIADDSQCGIANCGSTTFFDQEIEDTDVSILQDTEINFDGKDIDIRTVLLLGQYSPSIETSLTLPDDDLGADVMMKVDKDSIKYLYVFDKSINLSTATSTISANVRFLGQRFKIVGATNTSITAQVGEEFFMDTGDAVTVEGKTITLLNVASSSVVIDVDGEQEFIDENQAETVNGIEILVDGVFDAQEKGERSAVLVIGLDAKTTNTDGDDFSNLIEDWDWDIGYLTSSAPTVLSLTGTPTVTSGPYFGIENDFTINSDDDDGIVTTNAATASCYTLPGDFIELCLDSLSVSDTDYVNIKVEFDTSLDTSKGITGGGASRKAILIRSVNENQGLQVESDNLGSLSADFKTNKIWLHINATDSSMMDVFYRDDADSGNSPKLAGTFAITASETNIGRVFFQDTKGNNAEWDVSNQTGSSDLLFNLTLDIAGSEADSPSPGTDDLVIEIGHDAGTFANITSIGPTADSEEAGELTWGANSKNIGTKDEDHRGIYGVIVKDPKSHGANDEVVLDVPGDQVLANVVVKGTATAVSGGTGGTRITVPITTDLAVLSSEISNPADHNLVLVGGPCVNPTIAQVSGLSAFSSCEDWSLQIGEGILKLAANGDKVAILVAGTNALDTRRVAKVLANYPDYADKFVGTELKVVGTSLTDISIV